MNRSASSGSTAVRVTLFLLAIAAGVCLALTLQVSREVHAKRRPLPDLGEVPDFTLTDTTGARFSRDSLYKKVWTANLFFTRCTSLCPMLTRNLAQLQKEVGPAIPFHLLSISVDPENDTPPVMAAYAAQFGADATRWHFVSGPMDTTANLIVDGLKLGTRDEPANHSPYVALIDQRCRIRGYYDGRDAEALHRLAEDIQRVAAERPQKRVRH